MWTITTGAERSLRRCQSGREPVQFWLYLVPIAKFRASLTALDIDTCPISLRILRHAFYIKGTRMKRNRTRNLFGNPFLIWAEVALKTGEMMMASAQVVGHRTRRLAAARSKPSSRDRREFTLMGQEKVEAAAESAHGIAKQMMTMDPLLGARVGQQMLEGAAAMMSLAGSRTASQAIARQASLVRIMVQSVGTLSRISGSSARLAHSGLKPIHSRAMANAKRLGKR